MQKIGYKRGKDSWKAVDTFEEADRKCKLFDYSMNGTKTGVFDTKTIKFQHLKALA